MKATDEKLSTYFNQELIDGAKAAAVNSKEWALLLTNAIAAGDIDGALACKNDRTRIWHTLSDRLSGVAPFAVTFGAPITKFLVYDLTGEAETIFAAFDKAESALCEGGTQAEIDACNDMRTRYREAWNVVNALTDFRLLCGVVNAGIKAAQENAAALARKAGHLAQKGNSPAQKARDAIVKMIRYDLEKYGLKVNLQKVQAEVCDVVENVPDTDAEKAAKAIVSAFKLDPSAALDAILNLEATTLATLRNAIERQQKAAQIETQKQDSEHKAGAVEQLAENMDGKPTDLATVGAASRESRESARRLADLEAQGTTPQIQADLEAADSKGRKVAGL